MRSEMSVIYKKFQCKFFGIESRLRITSVIDTFSGHENDGGAFDLLNYHTREIYSIVNVAWTEEGVARRYRFGIKIYESPLGSSRFYGDRPAYSGRVDAPSEEEIAETETDELFDEMPDGEFVFRPPVFVAFASPNASPIFRHDFDVREGDVIHLRQFFRFNYGDLTSVREPLETSDPIFFKKWSLSRWR